MISRQTKLFCSASKATDLNLISYNNQWQGKGLLLRYQICGRFDLTFLLQHSDIFPQHWVGDCEGAVEWSHSEENSENQRWSAVIFT